MKNKSPIRVKTGIPGFDNIINGGFVENSVNLVSGGAGTGKSIFGMQFLYNGATKYNDNGVFVSFEEDLYALREDAIIFEWDFDKLEKKGKVLFIYLQPYQLGDYKYQIESLVNKIKARRVVIDSSSSLGLALENKFEVRKEIYSLARQLKKLDCTSILTSEIVGEAPLDISSGGGGYSRFGVEEFVCDSVIILHYSGLGGSSDRAIRVVKMRRTDHIKGPVPMKIGKDGIQILKK